MKTWLISLTTFILILSFIDSKAQTAGLDQSLMVSAEVFETPPKIQLKWWRTVTSCQGFTISRKKKKDANFVVIIPALSDTALQWTDTSVQIGEEYEYKVFRYGSSAVWGGPLAWGYISAGIKVEPETWKGNLLLLVDSTLVQNSVTKNAIWQWKQDVAGEGWEVIQLPVLPTETVVAVRQKVKALNNQFGFRSLFILGRVPIPYSGRINPDAHGDHLGAWPTDIYYGDTVSVNWTDNQVNIATASDPRNRNIPGDGKFDPSSKRVDLELGRVDMRNLPMFGLTEAQLIRRYLLKNHKFRTAEIRVKDRAMQDDQATGLNFSATGWRGYSTLCRDWNSPFSPYGPIGTGNFRTSCRNHDYLWSGSWGPGSYQSVGTNSASLFVSDSLRTVFTAFIGSYLGDWDNTNNFLRASLANKGPLLTTCWSGRPFWYFHHMGMGESIGYSARLTTNNFGTYESGPYAGLIHIELLGDPSLKLHPIAQVKNLTADIQINKVLLNWNPPIGDTIDGYHVFKKHPALKRFYKISKSLITANQFIDTCLIMGQNYYMVRPFRLERSNTGTYFNYGTGTIDTILLTVGRQVLSLPTLKILPITNIPFCPSLAELKVETTGNPAPHYFKWFINGIFVDTSRLPAKILYLPARKCTLQCQMVSADACGIPDSVWSQSFTVNLPFPPSPLVSIETAEICKHQINKFKANITNGSFSNFNYTWFKNNQILSGEVNDTLDLILNSTAFVKVKVICLNSCGLPDSSEITLTAIPLDTVRPTLSTSIFEIDSCSSRPPFIRLSVNVSVPFKSIWFKNGLVLEEESIGVNGIKIFEDSILNGDQFQLSVVSKKNCTTIDTLFSPKYTTKVVPSGDPFIKLDSAVQLACQGRPFSLSTYSQFQGNKPKYQWFLNGIVLTGDTTAAISLPQIQLGDSLKVRLISNSPCRINSLGIDTFYSTKQSFVIEPVVVPTIFVSSNIPATGLCEGFPIRFTAKGQQKGLQPIFSWMVNNTLLPPALDSVLILNTLKANDSLSISMLSSLDCAFPAQVRSPIIKPLILPKPKAQIVNQQNSLSVTGQNGIVFQWFRNGLIIAGATDSVYLPQDSGFYTVVLVNLFSCTDTSAPLYITVTSVLNKISTQKFQVFPNPASDLLFIDSGLDHVSEIEVKNTQGKNILIPKFIIGNAIPISVLPSGFYIISAYIKGVRQAQRFVKH